MTKQVRQLDEWEITILEKALSSFDRTGFSEEAKESLDRLENDLLHATAITIRRTKKDYSSEIQKLKDALAMLRLEAIHYRNTHVGIQFLNAAIDAAETALSR